MSTRRIAILTRPASRNAGLARRLEQSGWEVLVAPALSLIPSDEPADQDPEPSAFDLVIFVSGAAAQIFLDRRVMCGRQVWPVAVPAAVVGPASGAALRAHPAFGNDPQVVCPPASAPNFDSEALYAELTAGSITRRRVLIVRGTTGREWLAGRLTREGNQVRLHAAYRREAALWPDEIWRRLSDWQQIGRRAVWLYTSAEGIAAVGNRLGPTPFAAWWAESDAIITHPRLRPILDDVKSQVFASLGAPDPAGMRHAGGSVILAHPEDQSLFDAFVAL